MQSDEIFLPVLMTVLAVFATVVMGIAWHDDLMAQTGNLVMFRAVMVLVVTFAWFAQAVVWLDVIREHQKPKS